MIFRAFISGLFLMLLSTTGFSAPDKAEANAFLIDTWQTPQGLPENLVDCILQTRDGYLWVGTYGGLARFDGIRFVTFGVHNSKGFRHNRIISLFEDRAGDLWIGSDGGGVTRYHGGQFINYGVKDGLTSDTVRLLGQGTGGGVCMTDNGGRYNRWLDGKITTHPMDDLPKNLKKTQNWRTNATGQVWITFGSGTNCLVPESIVKLGPFSEARKDRSGNFWVLGSGFVARLRAGNQDNNTKPEPLLKDDFTCFCEGSSGDFWVGTARHGLLHWKEGQGEDFEPVAGIPDVEIRTIYEDREGDIWVGSTRGGLTRLRPRPLEVLTEGLQGKDILTVTEDTARRLWVSTYEAGLFYTDLNGTPNHRFYPLPGPYNQPFTIWSLCSTRDGALWIGTWGGGLFQIKDGQTNRFIHNDINSCV